MLVAEKPPLDENLLIHYGIPGMRWGYRKPEEYSPGRQSSAGVSPSSGRRPSAGASPASSGRFAAGGVQPVARQRRRLSQGQKKAIRAAVAVGAVAGLFILAQRGMTPRGKALQARTLPIGIKANQRILGAIGKNTVRSVPKVITTTAKTAKVTGKVGIKTAKVTGKVGFWAGKKAAAASYRAAVNRGEQVTQSYRNFVLARELRKAPKQIDLGTRISESLLSRFGSNRIRS